MRGRKILNERSIIHQCFSARLNRCDVYKRQRLYRFDKISTANRCLSYLASIPEDDDTEVYEDIIRDRIESWLPYEQPWIFTRELTAKDWEKGGLFYEIA